MQNNSNNGTFCVIPWLGMSTKSCGTARVCCLMSNSSSRTKGALIKENGQYYNLGTDSTDEIKNAPKAKEVRLALLAGERIEECNTCWIKESNNSGSRRIVNNNAFKDVLTESEAREQTAADGSINIEPAYWDLRFGNLCNLKCVMCHPASSSQWYEDYAVLNNTLKFGDSGKKMIMRIGENGKLTDNGAFGWWQSKTFWQNMELKIPFIQQVYLVGGEPMLIEPHYAFLQKIIDSGRAPEVTLEYDTNLTALHSRAYDLWKNFKKVILRVSLEDIGPCNDYIRFPSRWQMIEKNLKKIESWAVTNIEISVTVTWQVLNSFTFLNLLDYLTCPVHVRILSLPEQFDVGILPRDTKEELIAIYEDWQKRNPKRAGMIAHLVTYLQSKIENYDPKKLKLFFEYIEKLDVLRDTNWVETFPQLYASIKLYDNS